MIVLLIEPEFFKIISSKMLHPIQMKSSLSTIITSLFIFLFVYTSISKLLDFTAFQAVLHNSPLIGNKARLIAMLLPTIELFVAGLLFIKVTRRLGYWAALSLMIIFTAYILYMLLFIPHLPCACGGVLRALTWKEHLAFNLIFICLALLELLLGKDSMHLSPTRSIQIT